MKIYKVKTFASANQLEVFLNNNKISIENIVSITMSVGTFGLVYLQEE